LIWSAAFAWSFALVPAALATPQSSRTALVTLGDSFISGEAGRWQGNSSVTTTDRAGTDRAWTGSGYDPSRVYGATEASGCHRSDVAEAVSNTIPVDEKGNLACSGAVTANIFRESQGGQGQKGEPTQAQKLRYVAQVHNVKLVVLSIVGNDLGFADIIQACAQAYAARTGPCNPSQQAVVDSRKQAAFSGLEKAIREVRAVMTESGYARSDYRFILQSYGSPIASASETRYPELGTDRGVVGGCPFYDDDLNWARNSLVKQIADGVLFVGVSQGVEVLDLRDELQGHEVCANGVSQASLTQPPTGATMEWARFLTLNLVQGEIQETLHPNVYGQKAVGRCLSLAWAAGSGVQGRCRPTAGQGPESMVYTR
jgi:hypothetical protein